MPASGGSDKGDPSAIRQALVVADSFDVKFAPLTSELPRALLPLASVPLIEYTLECLAAAGIDEVFVFCCAKASLLQRYFEEREVVLANRHNNTGQHSASHNTSYDSPLAHHASSSSNGGAGNLRAQAGRNSGASVGASGATSGMKIKCIVHPDSHGVGDALREMDRSGLLKGDFVLLQGDVVSNVDVGRVLAAHTERRKTVRQAIMTMVLKPGTPKHLQRLASLQEELEASSSGAVTDSAMYLSHDDDVVVAIDPRSQRLLHYHQSEGRSQGGVEISADLFANTAEVLLRNDLIDCRIDICSPEVLALFTDEFDYQDLRQDFVRNVVTPAESGAVHGYEIYTEIISDEYARRVKGVPEYYAVSRDIIHRWVYPMCLDNNLLFAYSSSPAGTTTTHGGVFTPGSAAWVSMQLTKQADSLGVARTNYRMQRHMIYKENDVMISRSATIKDETAIGSKSVIEDRAILDRSVVGRRCHIGVGAKLTNCFLWDNVEVGERCVISEGVILCSGVRLLAGTTIGANCIVSFNTTIGPDVAIPGFSRITSIDHATLAALAEENEMDSGLSIDIDTEEYGSTETMDLGVGGHGYKWSPAKEDDDSDSDNEWSIHGAEASGITSRHNSEKGLSASAGNRDEQKFVRECREILIGSIHSGHSDAETKLELKGRQLAYDMQEIEVAVTILRTLLGYLLTNAQQLAGPSGTVDANGIIAEARKLFSARSGLLMAFVEDKPEEKEKDQVELVWVVLELAVAPARAPLNTVFPMLLHALFDADILEEEALFKWEAEVRQQSDLSPEEQALVDSCESFFAWLRESDSESESESGSTEEESSD